MRQLFSVYVDSLRGWVVRPTQVLGFVVGSMLYAGGHAALALSAGLVAKSMLSPLAGQRVPRLRDLFAAVDATVMAGGDGIAAAAALAHWRDVSGSVSVALAWAAVGLLAAITKTCGGVAAAAATARGGAELGRALRLRMVRAALATTRLTSPLEVAPRLTMASNHVRAIEDGLRDGVLAGARALVQGVPLVIAVVVFTTARAWLPLLLVLPLFAVTARVRARMRDHALAEQAAEVEFAGVLEDAVRQASIVRVEGAEAAVLRAAERAGECKVHASTRWAAWVAAAAGTGECVAALGIVAVVWLWSGGAWMPTSVSATELVLVVTFGVLLYKPLRELVDARTALLRADVALRAFTDAIERDEASLARGPVVSARPISGPAELRVEGLVLPRGGSGPVSFQLPPGGWVVVEGPNGVGKTTLLRVLLGLEARAGGIVRFGGRPLDDAPPGLRPFAWVSQDAALLRDEWRQACENERTPLGLFPPLPRGRRHLVDLRTASGGERQWTALERALRSQASVLLLDEPTSALAPDAEAVLLDTLSNRPPHVSIVMVTHRPASLRHADAVLQLSPGQPSRFRRASALLTAVVAALALAGCSAPPGLTEARQGDRASLERIVRQRLQSEKLSPRDGARLAFEVARRELLSSEGADLNGRLQDARMCARPLDDALKELGSRPTAPALATYLRLEAGATSLGAERKWLESTDDDWRAVGARALTDRAQGDARRKALLDPAPRVRRAAMHAAKVAGDPADGAALLDAAFRDPDPLVRTDAVRALGSMPEGAVPELAFRLADLWAVADEALRYDVAAVWASAGVFRAGGEEALKLRVAAVSPVGGIQGVLAAAFAIARLVREPSPELVSLAAAAVARALESGTARDRAMVLAWAPAEAIGARWKTLAEDPAMEVRIAALARMVELPVGARKPVVDAATRAWAVGQLETLAAPVAVPVGAAAAAPASTPHLGPTDLQARARVSARFALARAHHEKIRPWLEADLTAPDPAARLLAAQALDGLDQTVRAAPLLADPEPSVRMRVSCLLLSRASP